MDWVDVLLTALATISAVAAWQVRRWVAHVERHVETSLQAYERLSRLEGRMLAVEVLVERAKIRQDVEDDRGRRG